MLRQLAKALGYSCFNVRTALLGAVFKNHQFNYSTKCVWGGAAYVIILDQVIPVLEYFIKLTLAVVTTSERITLIQDNARMEAQRLIEVFNREVFGNTDSENNVQEKSNDTEEDSSMEPIQLLKPTDKPTNVPVVAVKDIEDIGERALATVKVFRVAEKDALRAVTKLKAEEINRDLSPLLELLA